MGSIGGGIGYFSYFVYTNFLNDDNDSALNPGSDNLSDIDSFFLNNYPKTQKSLQTER